MMDWSEIDTILDDTEENLKKAGDRIQTARRNQEQTYHANHKPWYVKRIDVVRRGFLLLRRRLSEFDSISEVLQDLEDPLAVLVPPETNIEEKWREFGHAIELFGALRAEIRREQEKEFDILPRDTIKIDRKLCFVMMPFKPRKDFDPVYTTIRRTVKTRRLRCVRSDDVFDTRAVVLDIWENIRRSRVCIADISTVHIADKGRIIETKNANVFYELGMAHALPKRVILISRELRNDEKPVFDVNYVRCIYYKNTRAGMRTLGKAISKTLSRVLK